MIGRIRDKQTHEIIATLNDDRSWSADDPKVAAFLREHHTPLQFPSYLAGPGAMDLRFAAESLGAVDEYLVHQEFDPTAKY